MVARVILVAMLCASWWPRLLSAQTAAGSCVSSIAAVNASLGSCAETDKPTATTHDRSGNIYWTQKHLDGSTDVFGSNPRTKSNWSQHIDPARNLQYGVNKLGQFWQAPLTTPGFKGTDAIPPVGGFASPDFLTPSVILQPNAHDLWLEDWRNRPFDGPFRGGDAPYAAPTEPTLTPAEEAAARELAESRQRDAMLGVVLSRMQPGSLADAARAAARARCEREQDQNKRNSCLAKAKGN